MSTYNDNLQSIVLTTLQNQDTDQKNHRRQQGPVRSNSRFILPREP